MGKARGELVGVDCESTLAFEESSIRGLRINGGLQVQLVHD